MHVNQEKFITDYNALKAKEAADINDALQQVEAMVNEREALARPALVEAVKTELTETVAAKYREERSFFENYLEESPAPAVEETPVKEPAGEQIAIESSPAATPAEPEGV